MREKQNFAQRKDRYTGDKRVFSAANNFKSVLKKPPLYRRLFHRFNFTENKEICVMKLFGFFAFGAFFG